MHALLIVLNQCIFDEEFEAKDSHLCMDGQKYLQTKHYFKKGYSFKHFKI
jgi:hypothetical protein